MWKFQFSLIELDSGPRNTFKLYLTIIYSQLHRHYKLNTCIQYVTLTAGICILREYNDPSTTNIQC